MPDYTLRKLIGPNPVALDANQNQFNRYYQEGERGDKEAIPKWNGSNPARLLKPWLKHTGKDSSFAGASKQDHG